MAEKLKKSNKSMSQLLAMVKCMVGNCPMNSTCNVVTKLLSPGSPFHGVSVTTKMDGFAGCVVFAYLYNFVTYHHGLGEVETKLNSIPQYAWTTFIDALNQTLHSNDYSFRIMDLVTRSVKTSRERFFPHVAKLAKKLTIHENKLYMEVVRDPKTHYHHTTLSYTDITSYKMSKCRGAVYVHMVKFHPDRVDHGPTMSSNQGSQLPCQHKEVSGNQRVCTECGLVLGSVYEHEPIFENNVLVKHTTPEASWVPWNARYNTSHVRGNTKTRQDQHALKENRRAFHQRLELLRIQMPFGLQEHFRRMWDLCVEMGFSPSGTTSAKAGSFSLRVVVMAYMVWRLVTSRHEHVFDFDFLSTKVKYLVVDDEVVQDWADERTTSITCMPTWYLPSKMQSNIPYTYWANEYFGSDIVEDVVARAKSPENRPSSPPTIQPTPITHNENLRAWVKHRAADFQAHYVQKLDAYVVRVMNRKKKNLDITPEEIEAEVNGAIKKRIKRHGKRLKKVLTDLSANSTYNSAVKAFDYKLTIDGSPVTYRVMNKENDPCFQFFPIEFDDNRGLRLDYGVKLQVRFTEATNVVVDKMGLCYRETPCKQLRHETNECVFSLMEFTGKGALEAKVHYTMASKNQKKVSRMLRFSLDFSHVQGFKNQTCVRMFGQKNLLDHTTPTGVFQATLTGLPLRLVGVSQNINKYVQPLVSPVNAHIHIHGSSFSSVQTKKVRSRKTRRVKSPKRKRKRPKPSSV